MYYAQATNGVITSLLETPGVLPESENFIQIEEMDESLFGCQVQNGVIIRPDPQPGGGQ